LECRSLGEERSNYTHDTVRQMKQQDAFSSTSRQESSSGAVAISLLAGAGMGVIAGLLLAPEKGKDLRRQVANSATKVGTQVSNSMKKSYSAGRERASSWMRKNKGGSNSTLQKSPYTDQDKWDDQENRNMIDTARNTPGV